MSGISIALNGMRMALIGLDGMQVISVFVHGALDRDAKATLEAHGGNYREGHAGHLIWLDDYPVLPGDVVTVTFDADCDGADAGNSIAERYPAAAPSPKSDFTITETMAAEIRARPRLHDEFVVQVETSLGQQVRAASDERNTNVACNLLWDDLHPQQLRLHFRTYCFDDAMAKTGGTTHLKTMLSPGDSVAIMVVR